VLQVDFEKIIDPNSSLLEAVLPRRDSAYGQGILKKLAQKYSVDPEETWKLLPERFIHVVLNGDNELLRVQTGDKYISIYYKGIEDIIKDQYVR